MPEPGLDLADLGNTGPGTVRFFQQNMALLPSLRLPNGENLYRGRERQAALDSLVNFLLKHAPDIVGLSEMWVAAERQWLLKKTGSIYPHFIEGPGEADDLNVDGGLLLLSRNPFLVHDGAVYESCLGEDCLAQKGVLHGRITVPGEAPALDVFLTHLQNPTPLLAGPDLGPGSAGRGKVQAQLDQLAGFIRTSRQTQEPAILMGDLNSAAGIADEYDDLLVRLGRPADLWYESGAGNHVSDRQSHDDRDQGNGLTFPEHSTFAMNELPDARREIRHQTGKRLDYFLSYPGTIWRPVYHKPRVIQLESSAGRDSSDHYGLMIELAELGRK